MPGKAQPQPPGVAVECAVNADGWPAEPVLRSLSERAVAAAAVHVGTGGGGTLAILFTDDEEMRSLNARFRGKDKPTNVLSFPARESALPPEAPRHLGDIALGRETVVSEAQAGRKPFDHHLTHLIVHGFLHIVGYDHETPEEAEEMEEIERRILRDLAIDDPYA